MASVTFEHVEKRYGSDVGGRHHNGKRKPTIVDLSLSIRDHELLVLVGPSGCGKSTVLRMIAGLESITKGSLLIDGVRVNDVAPKNRDVAMVFQNYALYPHMTCFDNMAFALTLKGVSRKEIEARVLAVAQSLAIEPLLGRRPRELSGGQRQRIAIGRAIVREPRVFLMDEPLSNLDAKLRVSMRAEIKRLHRVLNTTIVYVTHDQTEAMTLGDRIAVLREGELIQIDTPHEIHSRPATAFVGTFIGSPEMNLFEGELGPRGLLIESRILPVPALIEQARRKVLIGVRPEHLVVADSASSSPAIFRGTVTLIESIGGSLSFGYATPSASSSSSVTGRIAFAVEAGQPLSVGEEVILSIAEPLTKNLHIFDRETEARIPWADSQSS